MCWACEGADARPVPLSVLRKQHLNSWQPQQIHLLARDGVVVPADRGSLVQLSPVVEQFAAAAASGAAAAAMLSAAAFDEPDGGACSDASSVPTISLPHLQADALRTVVGFCQRHHNVRGTPAAVDLAWRRAFLPMSDERLLQTARAARSLQVQPLLQRVGASVGVAIRECVAAAAPADAAASLREHFGIRADLDEPEARPCPVGDALGPAAFKECVAALDAPLLRTLQRVSRRWRDVAACAITEQAARTSQKRPRSPGTEECEDYLRS